MGWVLCRSSASSWYISTYVYDMVRGLGAGCTTATPDLAGQTWRYLRPSPPGTKPVRGRDHIAAQHEARAWAPPGTRPARGPAVAAEEALRANSCGDEGEIAAVAGAAVAAVAAVA